MYDGGGVKTMEDYRPLYSIIRAWCSLLFKVLHLIDKGSSNNGLFWSANQ